MAWYKLWAAPATISQKADLLTHVKDNGATHEENMFTLFKVLPRLRPDNAIMNTYSNIEDVPVGI